MALWHFQQKKVKESQPFAVVLPSFQLSITLIHNLERQQ
jgi:hypothetical protein